MHVCLSFCDFDSMCRQISVLVTIFVFVIAIMVYFRSGANVRPTERCGDDICSATSTVQMKIDKN